jgi:UDPglucose 6-dehydrogenase/GDP-mannose 6-dehydrogenase
VRVAVVGSGYVGLVTGCCLAEIGHDVVCIDVDPRRVAAIESGEPSFHEPGLPELLRSVVANGKLRASTDVVSNVAASDVTFIAVGTPSRDGDIDLTFVKQAAAQIGEGVRRNPDHHVHVVVVKSTVVPGTTARVVREALGVDCGLAMNPEFLREGSAVSDFQNPDRIVIGQSDERAGQRVAELYRTFDCPKIFTTLANAEMIKYASNALLATLISFSNEIAALCEATPATDVDDVLDTVHLDRRLSPLIDGKRIAPPILAFLRAGCGFGGSCLPKDVTALRAFAEKRGIAAPLLESVLRVNANRPQALVALAEEALGSLRGKTIAILGLAFKAGTDDVRESVALRVIDALRTRGANIRTYDPLVPSDCNSIEDALRGSDAAIITTAMPELRNVDWKHAAVVIDGRNALRGVALPREVEYIPIGRKREHAQRV